MSIRGAQEGPSTNIINNIVPPLHLQVTACRVEFLLLLPMVDCEAMWPANTTTQGAGSVELAPTVHSGR